MIFKNEKKWSDSPNEIEYQQGQAGSSSRTSYWKDDENLSKLSADEIAWRKRMIAEIREEIQNRKAESKPEPKPEVKAINWKKMNVRNRIPASVLKEIEAVLN